MSTSSISSQTGIGGGSAGDIHIDVNSLNVTDAGRITTATFGASDAANIIIDADTVELSGQNQYFFNYIQEHEYGDIAKANSFITSASYNYFLGDAATGNAGDITINATSFNMADSGALSTASFSNGKGGDVDINVARLSLDGNATINTNAYYKGDGGNLRLDAENLSVLNGSNISASSSSDGRSGNIFIRALQFELEGSKVGTSAKESDGGEIGIQVKDAMLMEDSSITTQVSSGIGSGGNIDIDPELLLVNRSEIRADAAGGDGGNIRIVADNLVVSNDSVISASSSLGIDGEIVVQAPNNDIKGTLQKLQQSQLNPAELFRNPCSAGSNYSQFKVSKKATAPVLQSQENQESESIILANADCRE
jgi:large exoprotein involved in heme utilization and adhesion